MPRVVLSARRGAESAPALCPLRLIRREHADAAASNPPPSFEGGGFCVLVISPYLRRSYPPLLYLRIP